MKAGILAALLIGLAGWILLGGDSSDPTSAHLDPEAELGTEAASGPELGGTGEVKPEPVPEVEAPVAITEVFVSGRVLGTSGKTLRVKVACGFIDPTGSVFRGTYQPQTGFYARAGLKPGLYTFRALAKGYLTHDALVEVPATQPEFTHDIQLQKSRAFAVRFVTPEGKPLRGSVPEAAEWLGRSLSVLADENELDARLPPMRDAAELQGPRSTYVPAAQEREDDRRDGRDGTLIVRGDLPLHIAGYLRAERIVTGWIDRSTKAIELKVDPATIRSLMGGIRFVLEPAGGPEELEDVFVMLHDRTTDEPAEDEVRREGAQFTIRDHPPGELHLQIHAGERTEPFVQNVVIEPGTVRDLGVLRLGAMRRPTVRLLGPDSRPLVGTTVWAYALDIGWEVQMGMPLRFVSDAKGDVRLTLGPRQYGLILRTPEEVWMSRELDLRTDATAPEKLQFAAPTRAALRTGSAALPVAVRILGENDRIVAARMLREPTVWSLGLEPGRYALRIVSRDGEVTRRTLTIGSTPPPMTVIE